MRNASPPQNASDNKSLLGMTRYVSRFIPNYATITAPLRLLTRQDMPWKWEQEQQKALEELKDALVGDQVTCYFDPRKKTEIIVDASPVGLSGLLTQEGKVLSYASRALLSNRARNASRAWFGLQNVFTCVFMELSFLLSLITSPSLVSSATTRNLQQGLKGGNFASCPMTAS